MNLYVLICFVFIVPLTTSYKLYIGSTNADLTKDLARLVQSYTSRKSRPKNLAQEVTEMQSIPSVEAMLPKGYHLSSPRHFSWKNPEMEYLQEENAYPGPFRRHKDLSAILKKIEDRDRLQAFPRRNLRSDLLYPEEYGRNLPKLGKINNPGHTLIQPNEKMLKSASKYPSDVNPTVYGNSDNLGTVYADGSRLFERVLNTDFRKNSPAFFNEKPSDLAMNTIYQTNSNLKRQVGFNEINDVIKKDILRAAKEPRNRNQLGRKTYLVQVLLSPSDEVTSTLAHQPIQEYLEPSSLKIEKNSAESDLSDEYLTPSFRRSKGDKRDNCTKDGKSESTESTSGEKNPGNPYTVWKNKYKWNWMWNHKVTGDHMNVNPWAPSFGSMGPSASELFFGRKWWYFNQDDFKPFR